MKKKSVPIVFAMLFVGAVAPHGEAATDLIINEISPVAPDGGYSWIEFYNPTEDEIAVAGSVVEVGEGIVYEVPESFHPHLLGESRVPPLQPGGFFLMKFGPGTPGVQVEDGPPHLIVVTAPAHFARPWMPSRGELMIRRPSPTTSEALELVDYVAWGQPGEQWSWTPERLALWKEPWFVPLVDGFGIHDPESSLAAGASIGLYLGAYTTSPENWVLFDEDEVTPGLPNSVPRPREFSLPDGAVVASKAIAVGWPTRTGDERYRFQLGTDPDFGNLLVDSIIDTSVIRIGTELPSGTYFYRVKAMAGMGQSKWCGTRRIVSRATPCDLSFSLPTDRLTLQELLKIACGSLPECKIISSVEFKFQRKDTRLVCLHSECDTRGCPWDEPHPYCFRVSLLGTGGVPWINMCALTRFSRTCGVSGPVSPPITGNCDHGSENCVRASISMMASAFKACLSQDLIAFHNSLLTPPELPPITPEWELGHNLGMNCNGLQGGECSRMLKWSLGTGPSPPSAVYKFTRSKPDFQDIRQWIDAGRPIMTEAKIKNLRHARVLTGYCVDREVAPDSAWREWVFVYDPKTGPRPEPYSSWSRTASATWVGPPTETWDALAVERDSSDIWNDFDNDGLMDFDEIWRFSTSPFDPDSNGDGTGDKEEDLLVLSTNPA